MAASRGGRPAGGRRAWFIWGAAVFAYLVAVTQRTTFGVAGLAATDRFDASASILAMFTVVQILVYALLQVPVGVLVDRFGPRAMIVSGAFLMACGQLILATADTVSEGVGGRLLVGAGDATTFVSALRLLPVWFSPRRIPVMTQFTGMVGQLGQIVSVVPFAVVLRFFGWGTAFTSAAALSVIACAVSFAVIRDSPNTGPRPSSPSWRQTGEALQAVWREPGTKLGLWTHFTTQFSGTVFVLIWGYPYLVSAEGVKPAVASALLTVFVVVGMVVGPLMGVWVGRHPLRRSTMVMAVAGLIAAAWASVLLYPGPAPLWLLILLIAVLAVGGPTSMIAFDFARTFNRPHHLGTATGVVNVGGFLASLITMYLIGLILDLLVITGYSTNGLYGLASFRIALAVQFIVLGVGISGLLVMRKRTRGQLARTGVVVPPLRVVVERERRRRQSARQLKNRRGRRSPPPHP